MDEEEDDDVHMCLVCHTTIKGLINYVTHKKTQCIGKKSNKGEVQQTAPTQSTVSGGDVPYLTQKYPDSQQYNTDFTEFSGTTSSHTNIIDFETDQFGSQHVGGVNKTQSLDNVLYTGTHGGSVKTGSLFDQPVTGKNMDIVSSQSSLDIPVPAPLNLSPSMFRSEHASLSGNSSTNTGLSENHGLLDGCINNDHLDSGFNPDIAYPVLNTSTVQTGTIMSDIMTSNVSKEIDNQSSNICEKVDDFFQSLELMSKNDPRAEKVAGFGQPLANLPISNILSNLTFSSDEEEFSFDFADDVSFDSLSDDSDMGSNITSKTQTFQSSSIKARPKFRGKWPPGQAPTTNTPKQNQRATKGGKKFPPETFQSPGISQGKLHSQIKAFTCSVCDLSFSCRYKYSNHFGSVQHKQCLLNRRTSTESRRPYKSGRGKSFKLIREVNKQYENDPFSQPFTSDKVTSNEKESADIDEKVVTDIKEGTDMTTDNFANDKEVEKAQEGIKNFGTPEPCEGSKKSTSDPNEIPAATSLDIDGKQEEGTADKDQQSCKVDKICDYNKSGANTNEDDSEEMYRAVPLYICTICDRKYPNKYYLSRHLITLFHRTRALSQPNEAFALLQQYHKYIVRLSPYQCAICRFYFNSYKEFLNHLKSESHIQIQDNLVAEIMCSLCKFRTHFNDELLQHVKSEEHISKIRRKEKICIVKESHIQCKCKYCGLVMNSYTRLKRHNLLKHKEREFITGVVKRQIGVVNRPKCTICCQVFASKASLVLHMRRRHTKERPYRCDMCYREFADKHAYSSHLRTSRHLKMEMKQKQEQESRDVRKILEETDSTQHVDSEITGTQRNNIGDNNLEGTSGIDDSKPPSDSEMASDVINKTGELSQKTCDLVPIENSPQNEEPKFKRSREKIDDDYIPNKLPNRGKKVGSGRVNGKSKVERKGRKRVAAPVGVKDKTYKCNHCSFTVTAYNDLRPHYLKEHAAQTTICELCDIVFLSAKAMKLHILSKEHQENINMSGTKASNDVQYYECHVCKKKFTDEKYCKFHTAYQHFHITTEEGIIKEYGVENSVTRVKFKQALADMEHLPHDTKVQCPECKVKFKKQNFLEHLRLHTGEKPFKCKMCPKAFMANVTLRKHLLGHFGCQERTCEICKKHFKKASSYAEHMQVHEAQNISNEKMHVCETCGLSFYLAKQLQGHVRRHRSKEFKCTVPGCHWKFLFSTELKYHMRSHSKEKPYLCDICGYSATSKYRLNRHHKTHTGERNFHCDYCSYKAGNKTHLHRHMRIHIGSKPFQCPYCEYACNTHENMRKHIIQTKKHVGMKIYPCKFCDFGTNSCNDFRNHLMELHDKEIEPEFNLMNGLSKFTGLYRKDLDPKQPIEGNRIHQVRERIPKVKKNADDTDENVAKKNKSKNKSSKIVDQQARNHLLFMDVQGISDVSTILDEAGISVSTDKLNPNTGVNNLIEMKPLSEYDPTKPIDVSHKSKTVTKMGSQLQQQRFQVSTYDAHSSYNETKSKRTVEKLGSNSGGRHSSSTQNDQIQSPDESLYDDVTVKSLGFSQGYVVHTPEVAPKQNVINYRSLLKGGTVANIPMYQSYNSYTDQHLHGNSSHDYSSTFSSNQVTLYPSNRVETGSMMPENLHRTEDSAVPYYTYKRLKTSNEDREQTGNLIIDLGFDKKHC